MSGERKPSRTAIRLAGSLPGIQRPARLIAERKPNLIGGALNGRSEIHSISPSSVQAPPNHAPFRFRFQNARSARKQTTALMFHVRLKFMVESSLEKSLRRLDDGEDCRLE